MARVDIDRPIAPRLVPDTNVFVAAYWNPRSASACLLRLCERGQARLCLSPATLDEIRYQLARQPIAEAFRAWTETLFVAAKLASARFRLDAIPDDPTDNRFLECAVAHHADVLASSDHHLLELDEFGGTPILSPSAALRFLEGAAGDDA